MASGWAKRCMALLLLRPEATISKGRPLGEDEGCVASSGRRTCTSSGSPAAPAGKATLTWPPSPDTRPPSSGKVRAPSWAIVRRVTDTPAPSAGCSAPSQAWISKGPRASAATNQGSCPCAPETGSSRAPVSASNFPSIPAQVKPAGTCSERSMLPSTVGVMSQVMVICCPAAISSGALRLKV